MQKGIARVAAFSTWSEKRAPKEFDVVSFSYVFPYVDHLPGTRKWVGLRTPFQKDEKGNLQNPRLTDEKRSSVF